jgi:hypothetical protein
VNLSALDPALLVAARRRLGVPLALGFVFVRHVLVAGPIDLTGIELAQLWRERRRWYHSQVVPPS